MSLIEKLVHNYRHGRNNPRVIQYASVAYYQTGHPFYAWHWALNFLWGYNHKADYWYDEHYFWRFSELTSFISNIAKICEYPINHELQIQIDELEITIGYELNKDDFLWSKVSDLNRSISELHQKMISPFSEEIGQLDIRTVFIVIEIVTALYNCRNSNEFAKYIFPKPIEEAWISAVQCMETDSLVEIRSCYTDILHLFESIEFVTPIPESITYEEYWNRTQVAVLSDHMKHLDS